MPYNEQIDHRIQSCIASWKNTDRKYMFGGVCHLRGGNMFCGVYRDFLILRLGEKNAEKAMGLPHVKPFDIGGKPMKGWVMVSPDGFASDRKLAQWLGRAKQFVDTLAPKS